MRTESLMACPDRLVPAARKVTGTPVARGQAEQLGHFVLVLRADDDLRDEAVESGVRAPGQAAQFVGIDAFLRDERLDVVQEVCVRVVFCRFHILSS